MPESEKSEEYIKGYEQGVKDFAERIKKYYESLRGTTFGALVTYNIEQIEREITEKVRTL